MIKSVARQPRSDSSMSRPVPPFISGPSGNLETLAEGFDKPFKGIAIICHPHPLHGGTMQNKVVHYLARTLRNLGLATLRFNFRGVGKSEGKYGESIGETADLLAIIDWVTDHYPGTPLWLAGFSFGGYVALRGSTQREVKQLITIAPSVSFFDASDLLPPDCPWLLVQGKDDDVVPHRAILDWLAGLKTQPTSIYLDGVGHFFHGKLPLLSEILLTHLQPAADRLSSLGGQSARHGL